MTAILTGVAHPTIVNRTTREHAAHARLEGSGRWRLWTCLDPAADYLPEGVTDDQVRTAVWEAGEAALAHKERVRESLGRAGVAIQHATQCNDTLPGMEDPA